MKPIWKFLLNVTALLVGAAQLTALLGLIAYWLPLSLNPINGPLSQWIESASGLQLDWRSGGISWRNHRLEVRGPLIRFADRSGAFIDFEFEKAVVHFATETTSGSRRLAIERVELIQPDRIDLLITDQGIELHPPLALLLDRLAKRAPSPAAGPIPSITCRDLRFSVNRRQRGAAAPLFSLTADQLQIRPHPKGGQLLSWKGTVEDQDPSAQNRESTMAGTLHIAPAAQPSQLHISAAKLLLPFADFKTRAELHGLTLQHPALDGAATFRDGALSFDGQLTAQSAQYNDAPANVTIDEGEPALRLQLRYSTADSRLHWDEFHYTSTESDLRSTGTLRLAGSVRMKGETRLTRLNPRWAAAIQQIRNWQRIDAALEPGGAIAIKGGLEVGGSHSWPTTSGTLTLDRIRLKARHLPRPFENISGALSFTPNRFECPTLTGRFGRGRIAFNADGDTALIFGKAGAARLATSATFTLEDMLQDVNRMTGPLIPDAGGAVELAQQVKLSGDVQVRGEARARWPNNPRPTDFEIDARSTVTLSNGRFEHPDLPEPIVNIHGALVGVNNRLELTALTGEVFGAEAEISGVQTGEGFFWRQPRLDARLALDLELSELLEKDRLPLLKPLARYETEGRVVLMSAIAGPAYLPRAWKIRSHLELRNVAFDPCSSWIDGQVAGLNGRLRQDGGRVTIDNVTLRLGGLPLTVNGSLHREQIQVTIGVTAPLDGAQRVFPRVLGPFHVAGDVEGFARLTVTRRGAAPTTAGESLAAAWRGVLDDVAAADWPYELHVDGQLAVEDATFSHLVLPEKITGINGLAHYRDGRLTFNGATANVGNSAGCKVDGDIQLRRENMPKLDFNVSMPEFVLDDWARRWDMSATHERLAELRERYHLQPSPPWSEEPHECEVSLTLTADRMRYRQYTGTGFSGRLNYTGRINAVNEAIIRDLSMDCYDGRLDGATTLTFPYGQPVKYEYRLQPRNIDLSPFLTAVRKLQDETKGRLSGDLRLWSEGADLDRLQGRGEFTITDSQFVGNIIMKELMKHLPFIKDLRLATVKGPVEIRDRQVFFDKLLVEMLVARINAKGHCGFDKTLDFDLLVEFYEPETEIIGLKQVLDIIRALRESVLAFHLTGTLNEPNLDYKYPLKEEQQILLQTFQDAWSLIPTDKLPNLLNFWRKNP